MASDIRTSLRWNLQRANILSHTRFQFQYQCGTGLLRIIDRKRTIRSPVDDPY